MRLLVCLILVGFHCLNSGSDASLVKRQAEVNPEDRVVRATCTTNTGATGHCTPLASCQVLDVTTIANNVCNLEGGSDDKGVCCPDVPAIPASESPDEPLLPATVAFSVPVSPSTSVSESDVNAASAVAVDDLAAREKLEQTLLERGLVTQPGSAEALHQQIVFASPEAQSLGKDGLLKNEASIDISVRLNPTLPPEGLPVGGGFGGGAASGGFAGQAAFAVPEISIADSPIAKICPPEPSCPATKFRSFDGSCNNLQQKDWGKSFRAFQRLSNPQYADRVSAPRVALDGKPLPSVRLVSTTVLGDKVVELPDVSILFTSYGQFLDHDLTLTPAARGANGSGILCCDPTVIRENLVHPECFAIEIPANDPFYSGFKQTCMEFVRSIPAPPATCTLGHREQMNQLTAYIDGSQIYGSQDTQANNLRSNEKGRLKVSNGSPGREFPPHTNAGTCKGDANAQQFCFLAGDVRSSEQPLLATLQVMFLREHNRVAAELAELNPGWNDEILYHEARRIVGAKLQHITYNEFLPIVLGNRVMRRFDLQLQKVGFWNKYDTLTDATIMNEFATAAYRFGHSNIPSVVQLFKDNKMTQSQRLRDHFSQPYDGKLVDNYVEGFATQGSLVTDNEVTEELTEHLFERGNRGFGLDLPSLNMQRGRDHAIATYTQIRKMCQLPPVNSFTDLAPHMFPGAADKLASLYSNVEDIDLWIGGVSEKSLPGAAVGPTFACIIAEQFRRTRKGDRFWYERGGAESSFSEAQLEQLKETSMARILCDNSDVKEMQPLAFLKPSSWNPKVSCDSNEIPKPLTRPWKNEPVWT